MLIISTATLLIGNMITLVKINDSKRSTYIVGGLFITSVILIIMGFVLLIRPVIGLNLSKNFITLTLFLVTSILGTVLLASFLLVHSLTL